MAQASSVQREPSMEEILASIRRIIEDNDAAPGAKADGPDPQAPAADADSVPRPATDVAVAPPPPGDVAGDVEPVGDAGAEIAELDSFRAEFDEPFAETASEGGDEPTPARLADVQAELEARAAEADATEALTADEAEDTAMSAPEPGDREESAPFTESVNKEPVAGYDDMPSFDHPADSGSSTPVASAGAAHDDAEASSGEEGEEGMPSILSEVTGRRVAAAFDELSEAFEASRRKSFDEMAEEMLRPMLQDWLDNNLPTLVEKLVREEIERVARGGTR